MRIIFFQLILFILSCGYSNSILLATDATSNNLKFSNLWFKVEISPDLGGRICSLVFKKDSKNWISAGNTGIFMDHVTQQDWPGELLTRRYEYTINQPTDQYQSVTLWTNIRGVGNEAISGVKIQKTIKIYKNKPLIEAVYTLVNSTDKPKRPGLWIQNIVSPSGIKEEKVSYRPTVKGVLKGVYNSSTKLDKSIDFRFDSTSGWMAVMNPLTKEGIIFYMDYNWLKCLYCNRGANTQEWWYDPVYLPPGQSFETRVKVWPVSQLDSIQHADDDVVVSMLVGREYKKMWVRAAFANGSHTVRNFNATISFIEYPSRKLRKSKSYNIFVGYGFPPIIELQSDQISPQQDMLAVLKITGNSKIREITQFSAGKAILGTETQWTIPRPRKKRDLYKPENISKNRNNPINILHLKGVFSYVSRYPEIAKCMGANLTEGAYSRGMFGVSLSNFPNSYKKLMRYDIIVLDMIPADAIDDNMVEMLNDFVKQGGLLLVHGGTILKCVNEKLPSKLLPVEPEILEKVIKLETPASLDVNNPNVGMFQYSLSTSISNKDINRITSGNKTLLVYRKISKGITSVFMPVSLDDSLGDKGYWNASRYPKWMAELLKQLLNETDIYGGLQ